jgi:hypothetical protein
MTAYAAHGRLHLGEREELVERMVDDWWAARASGEAAMQASNWRDVVELNERARERLVEAGLMEPDGLDVRGVTVGVGDHVMVLRNAPSLSVINGTMATVSAIDRESGEIIVRTVEPQPREVTLPAWFWNAKGRRRLALAYCRTIHKAQGSTYRGQSFTLAGDDTIHLEAVHVALSRGTVANHLYYMGEPPPDEDHHAAVVEEAGFEGLVAAAGRSRAQVMALDLLAESGPDVAPLGGLTAGAQPARHWSEAPMTEQQVAVLARRGLVPDGDRTWVEASLVIDEAMGTPLGEQAKEWLRENGAGEAEAQLVIDRAKEALRSPPRRRGPDAATVRLDVLDGRSRTRRLTVAEAQECEALRRRESDAARERLRSRRRTWAKDSRIAANAPDRATPELAAAGRRGARASR